MACNPTRIELSNAATTTVQITLATDPGDGTTVTLEVDELGIERSATTTSAVASFSIDAVSAANNSIWDATIQVGANRPATAEVLVTETNTNQTVGVTIDDSAVTYCAPSGGGTTLPNGELAGDVLAWTGSAWSGANLYSGIPYVAGAVGVLADLKTDTSASVMMVGDSISNFGGTDFTSLWHAALFAWHPDQWGGAWFSVQGTNTGMLTLPNAAAITETAVNIPGDDAAFATLTNLRGQYSTLARGGVTVASTAQMYQFQVDNDLYLDVAANRPTQFQAFPDGIEAFTDADGTRRIADGTTDYRIAPMVFGFGTTDALTSVQLRGIDQGTTLPYQTRTIIPTSSAWVSAPYAEFTASSAAAGELYVGLVRQAAPTDDLRFTIQSVYLGRPSGFSVSYAGYGGWRIGNHSNAWPDGDSFTISGFGESTWSYSDDHIQSRMIVEGTTHLFVHLGANNVSVAATPAATMMAEIEDLVDRYAALRPGLKFVFTTLYGSNNDDAAKIANREAFNHLLMAYAGTRRDVVCIDLGGFLRDWFASHDDFTADWLFDDIHPNTDGAYAMQKFVWDRVLAANELIETAIQPVSGSGTVTSVDVTAGQGITSTGGPITSSGAITVAHQDQPVAGVGYDYVRSIAIDTLGHVATITADNDAATARQSLGLELGVDVATASHTHTMSDITDLGDLELNDLADVNIATGAGNDGDLVYFNNAGGPGDKFKGVARSSIGLSEFDNDLPAVEDSYLMLIESPSDKTYTLDGRVAAARTVTNFYAKTSSGTCTATLKNLTDATTIGTISVTSTGGSAASLSNTGLTANERIAIEISSTSSAEDLELVVEYTQ